MTLTIEGLNEKGEVDFSGSIVVTELECTRFYTVEHPRYRLKFKYEKYAGSVEESITLDNGEDQCVTVFLWHPDGVPTPSIELISPEERSQYAICDPRED